MEATLTVRGAVFCGHREGDVAWVKLCPGLHGIRGRHRGARQHDSTYPGSWEACALDEDGFKRLLGAVSETRFSPFLEACNGDLVRAWRLHAWDAEISRAFLGTMRHFEITLRHCLQGRLVALYGRADWWHVPGVVLHATGVKQIRNAESAVIARNIMPNFEGVVEKLPLGFWVGLIGKGVNYETQFWRPALRYAFPGYWGKRVELHRQLNYLRFFRNNIAHQEQIFNRHLEADFRSVCRVIRYMSPEAAAYAEQHSQVPRVLARKARVLSGEEPSRL